MSQPDPDLVDRVRLRLASDGADLSPVRVAEAIRAEGRLLGDRAVLSMVDVLQRDLAGLGPLTPLLAEPGITDILVNGPHQVFVDDSRGLRRTQVRFSDDGAVRRLAQRLASTAGRRLDDASPYVDVRLPEGIRFHAVLSPPARQGTCLSLRLPARRALTLDDLASAGLAPMAGVELLAAVVHAGLAFVISGGTGSGNTTHPENTPTGHARIEAQLSSLGAWPVWGIGCATAAEVSFAGP